MLDQRDSLYDIKDILSGLFFNSFCTTENTFMINTIIQEHWRLTMAKIHGAASAGENCLAGNINFYTMYVGGVDITATGDIADQSQQNFDDVCNLINLVAQPVIMNNPVAVTLDGLAPTLTGPDLFLSLQLSMVKYLNVTVIM